MKKAASSLVQQARASAQPSARAAQLWQLSQARSMSAVAAAHAKPVDGFSGAVGNTPLVRPTTFASCMHSDGSSRNLFTHRFASKVSRMRLAVRSWERYASLLDVSVGSYTDYLRIGGVHESWWICERQGSFVGCQGCRSKR